MSLEPQPSGKFPPALGFDAAALLGGADGAALHRLVARLYPICRSITGEGVRETLSILSEYAPIAREEVPTGFQAFDWSVPKEWRARDAYVKNADGRRVIDFRAHNLHLMGYSAPFRGALSWDELRPRLHADPAQPDVIPYRTSYYSAAWGFCLRHRDLEALGPGPFEVVVDTDLFDGHLTYGEYLHAGESADEVLLSAHVCHPSLANDNCSGLSVLAHLARAMRGVKTRLSYRFLFAPGTIGAIVWLARNEAAAGRIRHGLLLSCVGDGGGPVYKRSRRGDATIDRAAALALRDGWPGARVIGFSPYGYDERQYCSPGFDLPVGLLQRSQFGQFPQYHTSADDLDFVQPRHLAESYALVAGVIAMLENNAVLRSLNPKCEPNLGKRGLYGSVGGDPRAAARNLAMLWTLNQADGATSLIAVAEKSGLPFADLLDAARRLLAAGLVAVDGWQ